MSKIDLPKQLSFILKPKKWKFTNQDGKKSNKTETEDFLSGREYVMTKGKTKKGKLQVSIRIKTFQFIRSSIFHYNLFIKCGWKIHNKKMKCATMLTEQQTNNNFNRAIFLTRIKKWSLIVENQQIVYLMAYCGLP